MLTSLSLSLSNLRYLRRCGKEVRYVIDYYDGDLNPGKHKFAKLDVRPACGCLFEAFEIEQMEVVSKFVWDSSEIRLPSSMKTALPFLLFLIEGMRLTLEGAFVAGNVVDAFC